jgi:hypothetical protein
MTTSELALLETNILHSGPRLSSKSLKRAEAP